MANLSQWLTQFRARYGFVPTRVLVDSAKYREYLEIAILNRSCRPVETPMQLTFMGIPVDER